MNPLITNASNPQCSTLLGGGNAKLNSEQQLLHRACSIPAIIVGEIPKLIVTHEQNITPKASPLQICSQEGQEKKRAETTHSSRKNQPVLCSTGPSCQEPSTSTASLLMQNEEKSAVHEYYLSLLKEEYSRLKLIKLADELASSAIAYLDSFLHRNLPHLSAKDRHDLIEELIANDTHDSSTGIVIQPRPHSGRLSERKKRGSGATGSKSEETHNSSIDQASSAPSSSSNISRNDSCASNELVVDDSIPGADYHRQMCAYVLHLDRAICDGVVRLLL